MSDTTPTSVGKKDLVDALIGKCVVSKNFEVREVLEALPTVLEDFLTQNRTVSVPGIGKFVPENKEESEKRNPRTGEPVTVAAHRIVRFKTNAQLKAAVR